MKRALRVLLLTLLLMLLTGAWLLNAQQTQLTLVGQSPAPVPSIGALFTGANGGQTPIYYWVIARYPAGYSIPTGPAVANSTFGTQNLSATNSVLVQWPGVSSASGYDVLRSNTNAFPGPCTACATALNTAALTVTDTGAVNSAWPPAGVNSAQAASAEWTVDNLTQSTPFINVRLANTSMRMALLKGAFTANDCAKINSDGTVSSAGAACASGGVWGTITGTLANQLDLAAALTAKQSTTAKDAASGYAGLTAGTKIAAAQIQEVIALVDLSDVTAKQGNSTTVQMSTGAVVNDNCAKFDANGNVVDAGAPCGAGSAATYVGQQILYTNAAFVPASVTATFTLQASTALVIVEAWVLQTKTAYAGTGVTSATCTIGDGTTANAYGPTGGEFNLLTAGGVARLLTDGGAFTTTMAAQTVTLTCTANTNWGDGANTVLTAGALNVWLKTAALPALP